MGHLTMSTLTGLGQPGDTLPYLKLQGHRLVPTHRPPQPARGMTMSGLGQGSPCGPQPSLSSGERAQCCPELGWVIYDLTESEFGLCERAAAASAGGGAAPSAGIPSARTAEDPFAAVEARRQALEERREAAEEARFQAMLQEAQLRRILSQAKSIQKAEAAERRAAQQAEIATRRAKLAAAEARRRSAQAKQLIGWGLIAYVGAKALRLI